MGRSFSATPGRSSTTMLPLASSGISRVSFSLTRVPPRSKNSAALPFGLAIEKRCRLRVAPVNVVAHVRKPLVEDRDARFGLRFGDNQRRVDPNLGKVAHDHESALEALGKNQLGDFFTEQLLALEIAHQLDAYQQSLAADIADEFVF